MPQRDKMFAVVEEVVLRYLGEGRMTDYELRVLSLNAYMANRPTWRTKDRLCENCGQGLMAHERQVYCRPSAAFRSPAAPPTGT